MSNGWKTQTLAAVAIVAAGAAMIVAQPRGASRQLTHSGQGHSGQGTAIEHIQRSRPEVIELTRFDGTASRVRLCQATCGTMYGVACDGCGTGCGEARWSASGPIPWEVFAQGDYVGPARVQHVPEYALRVNDVIEVIYWFTL
nr:hypothetical protein [Planctomycetota bacterium]